MEAKWWIKNKAITLYYEGPNFVLGTSFVVVWCLSVNIEAKQSKDLIVRSSSLKRLIDRCCFLAPLDNEYQMIQNKTTTSKNNEKQQTIIKNNCLSPPTEVIVIHAQKEQNHNDSTLFRCIITMHKLFWGSDYGS